MRGSSRFPRRMLPGKARPERRVLGRLPQMHRPRHARGLSFRAPSSRASSKTRSCTQRTLRPKSAMLTAELFFRPCSRFFATRTQVSLPSETQQHSSQQSRTPTFCCHGDRGEGKGGPWNADVRRDAAPCGHLAQSPRNKARRDVPPAHQRRPGVRRRLELAGHGHQQRWVPDGSACPCPAVAVGRDAAKPERGPAGCRCSADHGRVRPDCRAGRGA